MSFYGSTNILGKNEERSLEFFEKRRTALPHCARRDWLRVRVTACPPHSNLGKAKYARWFFWCGNPKAIPITIWITDSKVRARLAARRHSESAVQRVRGLPQQIVPRLNAVHKTCPAMRKHVPRCKTMSRDSTRCKKHVPRFKKMQ